jgi:hypothetical protein
MTLDQSYKKRVGLDTNVTHSIQLPKALMTYDYDSRHRITLRVTRQRDALYFDSAQSHKCIKKYQHL